MGNHLHAVWGAAACQQGTGIHPHPPTPPHAWGHMHAPNVGVQQHASRAQADPLPHTHMPGDLWTLGSVGGFQKNPSGRGGGRWPMTCIHLTWGCSSMPAGHGQTPPPPNLGECRWISKQFLVEGGWGVGRWPMTCMHLTWGGAAACQQGTGRSPPPTHTCLWTCGPGWGSVGGGW